jgi:hypothetical protein
MNVILSQLPESLAGRVHFVWDATGPMIGRFIPLYRMKLTRMPMMVEEVSSEEDFLVYQNLIKDVEKYDASKIKNEVLGDDWRIVCAWYSSLKEGKAMKYSEDQILALAQKIYDEIKARVEKGSIKHEFDIADMKPNVKDLFERVSGISLESLSLKPFVPMKADTGYRKGEFFVVDDLWSYWAAGYIREGVYVDVKYDGMRMLAIKEGDKIAIYTEDALRDRAHIIPEVAAELKKLPGDFILDGEMVWWKQGKPMAREDMLAMISGKEPITGEDIRYNVFDILYLDGKELFNMPLEERRKVLSKEIPKDTAHIKRVVSYLVKNRDQLIKAVDNVKKYPGSEGAMCKWAKSTYKIARKGEPVPRTEAWAKLKIVYEVSAQVTRVIKPIGTKGPLKGKWVGSYIYEAAISNEQGKLIPIGRTYATKIKAEIGDILSIRTVRVEVTKDPEVESGWKVTWMFPIVQDKEIAKTKPDDINWAIKVAKASGKVTLSHQLLEPCPHFDSPKLCPLSIRYAKPMSAEELSKEKLLYPVKCPFAKEFRCRYIKDYYYSRHYWKNDKPEPK